MINIIRYKDYGIGIEENRYGTFGEKPPINIVTIPTIIQKPINHAQLNKILPQLKKCIDIIMNDSKGDKQN